MKKLIIILIAISFLLLSCAPAQAAPTEIPATEAPAATEEPLPESSKITFYFKLNYVPENWVENYSEKELATFYPIDNVWGSKVLAPVYTYKGPLFPIQIDDVQNKTGNCFIKSYYNTNEIGDQQLVVQPNCKNPSSEESAIISVRLPNCERDVFKNLTCKLLSDFGTLKYTLNKEQDEFRFQFAGSWDLSFESAMNTSLSLLGFTPPTEKFYKNTIPDKIYTIYKNPGGE